MLPLMRNMQALQEQVYYSRIGLKFDEEMKEDITSCNDCFMQAQRITQD